MRRGSKEVKQEEESRRRRRKDLAQSGTSSFK
jgi:hypothetical protein